MKSPRYVSLAVLLASSVLLGHAKPAFAQDDSDPFTGLREVLGGAFGETHNGSASAGQVVGYWLRCFGKGILFSPSEAPYRPLQTTRTPNPPTSGIQIAPAIVGEFGAIFSESTVTFMGGPRVIVLPPKSRVAAYGEFLFGALHFSGDFSGTDKLVMPAFGAIIAIPHNKLKVTAEIGFPIDFFDGFHETDTRFLFGVMLPLR